MTFSELINARYSVRAYQDRPVEDDKLRAILEAARLAPTAINSQPFQLIVIHVRGREDELKPIYRRDWLFQAPLLICVCALPDAAWVRRDGLSYHRVDATIVMDHIILAATEQGLGTCWVAAFDPDAMRTVLHLPENVEPVVLTPLGYAADQAKERVRKPLEELVRYERW